MKYLLDGQETERLVFRLLTYHDFDAWTELFREKDICRFFGIEESQSSVEKCRHWFARILFRYLSDRGGMNVLIEKKTNTFVGQCGILVQEVDGKEEMEIAYAVLPAYRNRGYATEAARKCLDFAFENNFTNHLVSIIHTENKRSESVALKCGMKPLRRSIFMDMPVTIYTIERTDWTRIQAFPQQILNAG